MSIFVENFVKFYQFCRVVLFQIRLVSGMTFSESLSCLKFRILPDPYPDPQHCKCVHDTVRSYMFMLHLDKSDEEEGEIISVYVAPGQE